MKEKVISRSPGEIFFFGEHAVVYGRRAIAAAINRWVTTTFEPAENAVRIKSGLGSLHAKIRGGELYDIEGDERLKVFAPGIQRVFRRYKQARGFKAQISSELPVASGLASSAASSASLLGGLIELMGHRIAKDDMVRLAFSSELDIQKRGSISGSACTVLGGIVEIENNQFKKWNHSADGLKIIVADSKEEFPTAQSTALVKKTLQRNNKKVEDIFDTIHQLSFRGAGLIRAGNWKEAGALLSVNQQCLRELGVSTRRIDSAMEQIKDLVYGAKITGAGCGGCFICLAKPGTENQIESVLRGLDFDTFVTGISQTGQEARLCKA